MNDAHCKRCGRRFLSFRASRFCSDKCRHGTDGKTCFVYVIDGPHAVKVGQSTTPEKRLRELQFATGHSDLTLASVWALSSSEAYRVERLAHALLARFRNGHGEWFDCHPLDAVAAVRYAVSKKRKRAHDVKAA